MTTVDTTVVYRDFDQTGGDVTGAHCDLAGRHPDVLEPVGHLTAVSVVAFGRARMVRPWRPYLEVARGGETLRFCASCAAWLRDVAPEINDADDWSQNHG